MLVIIRCSLFSTHVYPVHLAVEFSGNKINSDLMCHRQNHSAQAVRNLQLKPRQLKLFKSLTAVYLIFQQAIAN